MSTALGGFEWGEAGYRWPSEFEDPRFLKMTDCRIIATEVERRPELGPGYYRLPDLPKDVSICFAPPAGASKSLNRFEEKCSHLVSTEISRRPEMGPMVYDTLKYDTFPGHGIRAERLSPMMPTTKFSEVPRFFTTTREILEQEAASKVKFTELPKWMESINPDCGVPFSVKHRFTPRNEWKVENPHFYLRSKDGSFISEKMPHHRYIEVTLCDSYV